MIWDATKTKVVLAVTTTPRGVRVGIEALKQERFSFRQTAAK